LQVFLAHDFVPIVTGHVAAMIVAAVIVAKWVVQTWLERRNRAEAARHAGRVPASCAAIIDAPTYARSVEYTQAWSRFHEVELAVHAVALLAVLFSGVLPAGFNLFSAWFGDHAWGHAAFLMAVGLALAALDLPLHWHGQFRLEARFGFNTTTPRLWWADRLKGVALALAVGYPLLVSVLELADRAGARWWLWAWALLLGFQWLMVVLAPALILPLFNRFTPLPEGSLRDRLLALAARVGFHTRGVQVMDGSRRSRHSNAFFSGVGRFRKVVLFDTLVGRLTEPELEAVLAHEIGHFKLRHVPKMLVVSAGTLLAGLWLLAMLAEQPWFHRAFGFEPGEFTPALLLFSLLGGTALFWCSPVAAWWSRRNEYAADRFAAEATGETAPLISALRQLHRHNLGNLTPHPAYRAFYYSHPTLPERERALRAATLPAGGPSG
jgi:STE24 endopeptidase